MSARTVILVECDVVSPGGAAATLRFADRAIAPFPPSDGSRPNVAFEDRLIEAPTVRRVLFEDIQTLEPGIGVGTMALANADRALDAYQGHVWGEVRVWRWTEGQSFASARRLLTGPAAGTPAFDVRSGAAGRVRLDLYDYRLELQRPVQTQAYAGTTKDPGGPILEGGVTLKGVLKPLAFGNLLNAQITYAPVQESPVIYKLHDGPIRLPADLYAVQIFDRGRYAYLDFGPGATNGDASYSVPALEYVTDYTLPVSTFATWAPLALARYNANLVGTVAFGFLGDASGGYTENPGPIIARILGRLGVPGGRIGGSVSGSGGAVVVGAFVQDSTSAGEMIAPLARAGRLAVLPDRNGVWQAVTLAAPAGAASYTIAAGDVIALEADDAGAAGAGEFVVGYDRVWTTYRRGDLSPELWDTDEEARLAETWRWARASDDAYKARFPVTWRSIRIETALRNRGDAEALAAALKGLFGLRGDGRPRRQWRVTLEMTDAVLDVPLGATVGLTAPQFGIDDRFVLIGEEPLRPRRDLIVWTLWG